MQPTPVFLPGESQGRGSPVGCCLWGHTEVNNLPAMQETKKMWIQSLGGEEPLEEVMGTHSHILVWRIPWTKEPSRL